MENKFNEQDGLRVINQMISMARGNLERGAGKYFLLWGYVTFLASVVHLLRLLIPVQDGFPSPGTIWGIASLAGFVVTVAFIVMDWGKRRVKTYVGSVISNIWMGFGIGALLVSILLSLSGQYSVFIYPAITFLYTYALFVSSSAYRFRWMYIPVGICLVCFCSYGFISFLYFPLPMAIALLSGNIIPGHILNYKARKNV